MVRMTALASQHTRPTSDANTLGLDYRAEAARLPYRGRGPILDVHTHVFDVRAAHVFFEVADTYGIGKVWSMSPFDNTADITAEYGDRIEFIAVPDYAMAKDNPDAYTTGWLRRLEQFRERGSRIAKFWAAPRGREFHSDALLLDSPIRKQGIKLAYDLGYRIWMTHVGDPDTWFATKYADANVYGTKRDQYRPLEALLETYRDVTIIGAHMGGLPEDLDYLQGMLDRHPNYLVDCSATKWMVRELSKHPGRFREFCERNTGRVLFGSDIVATTDTKNADLDERAKTVQRDKMFDLFASRYWALRTMLETSYDGPSPIVDPDLHMVDPSLPEKSTAWLRGAQLGHDTLQSLYHDANERLFAGVR